MKRTKGGSWINDFEATRTTVNTNLRPNYRNEFQGFRMIAKKKKIPVSTAKLKALKENEMKHRIRGGSWFDDFGATRSAARIGVPSDYTIDCEGFRLIAKKKKTSLPMGKLKALKAGYEAELRTYLLRHEIQIIYVKEMADLNFKIAYLGELIKHETH